MIKSKDWLIGWLLGRIRAVNYMDDRTAEFLIQYNNETLEQGEKLWAEVNKIDLTF